MSEAIQLELLVSIYQFLNKSNLSKSAKSLSKETGLTADIASRYDPLDLISIYRAFHKKRLKHSSSSKNETTKRSKLDLESTSNSHAEHCSSSPVLHTNPATTESLQSSKNNKLTQDQASTSINNANKYFKRVTTCLDEIDPLLRDNSYEYKFTMVPPNKSWGAKANSDFKHTSGKSFRHEKTKKKRGSYKGGKIDQSVGSFKFQNSDDTNSD